MKTKITKKQKIGILGGMGPQASCELLRLIVAKATDKFQANNPEKFPEIMLDSIPVSDFISDTSRINEVRKTLVDRARSLRKSGCKVIVMACNSAHIMEKDLKKAIPREFKSLISMMGEEAKKRQMKKVMVLATPTTIKNKLYVNEFSKLGIKVIHPNGKVMAKHASIIRRVISGKNSNKDRDLILSLANDILEKHSVDGVILGCTELPVAVGKTGNKKILSSLEILADNLLFEYYNQKGSYELCRN